MVTITISKKKENRYKIRDLVSSFEGAYPLLGTELELWEKENTAPLFNTVVRSFIDDIVSNLKKYHATDARCLELGAGGYKDLKEGALFEFVVSGKIVDVEIEEAPLTISDDDDCPYWYIAKGIIFGSFDEEAAYSLFKQFKKYVSKLELETVRKQTAQRLIMSGMVTGYDTDLGSYLLPASSEWRKLLVNYLSVLNESESDEYYNECLDSLECHTG